MAKKKKNDQNTEKLPTSPLTLGFEAAEKALKKTTVKDMTVDLSTTGKVHPHIPTGAFVIDYLIGGEILPGSLQNKCPGLPRGKIFNLYGQESSGKTTLALTAAATTISMGGTVLYIDWEHAIVPRYAKSLGVPIEDRSKFLLVQPDTLEDGVKMLIIMARNGVDLIVIDSAGTAVPKADFERKDEELGDSKAKGQIALKWSEYLPLIQKVISKSNSAIIAISQTRSKINFRGPSGTAVQGGKAWNFFSAVRMSLRTDKILRKVLVNPFTGKKTQKEYGRMIKAKVEKCKVSESQGDELSFYIRYGEGIDNYSTMIDLGADHKIIKSSGAGWLSYITEAGDEIKGQGNDNFIEALKGVPGSYKEIIQKVLKHIGMTKSENKIIDEEVDEDLLDLDLI